MSCLLRPHFLHLKYRFLFFIVGMPTTRAQWTRNAVAPRRRGAARGSALSGRAAALDRDLRGRPGLHADGARLLARRLPVQIFENARARHRCGRRMPAMHHFAQSTLSKCRELEDRPRGSPDQPWGRTGSDSVHFVSFLPISRINSAEPFHSVFPAIVAWK